MYKMKRYEYSFIVPCLCEHRFTCIPIFNSDSRYHLDGFIEVRFYSSSRGGSKIVKRNIIHCFQCRQENDVLDVFPDVVYVAAQHVTLMD